EALLVPDGSIFAAFYVVLLAPPCGALGEHGTNPPSGGRFAEFVITPCRFQQAAVKEMAVGVLAAAVSQVDRGAEVYRVVASPPCGVSPTIASTIPHTSPPVSLPTYLP